MTKAQPRQHDFYSGLNTSRLEHSSAFPSYVVFEDWRVDRGPASRRAGMAPLGRFTDPTTILDFDGVNDYATIVSDARWWPLGTVWTLETLWDPDDLASTRTVLGRRAAATAPIRIQHTSGAVTVEVTDSAATTTTLTVASVPATAPVALQLVRNGAALTLWVNGSTDTDTMSATNALASTSGWQAGADNAGSLMDGAIEWVRLFRVAKAHQEDVFCRLLDPRAPSVVFDYVMEADAQGHILDRGPYGVALATTGSPATNRAPISRNHYPIQAIAATRNNDTHRKVYVFGAGRICPVTV